MSWVLGLGLSLGLGFGFEFGLEYLWDLLCKSGASRPQIFQPKLKPKPKPQTQTQTQTQNPTQNRFDPILFMGFEMGFINPAGGLSWVLVL